MVINYLGLHDEYNTLSLEEVVKQAKAMEKEQIIDAYWDGCQNWENKVAEQYYNETYKGGEQ